MIRMKGMRTFLNRVFLGILFAGLALAGPAFCCGLADHDWELVWTRQIELPGPLVPTAELDLCRRSLPQGVPKTIWWLIPQPLISLPGLLLLTGVDTLTSGMTWKVFPASAGLPNGPSQGEPPVYLRTDMSRLRVFVFRDRHATEACWQVAILQEGRIRGLWTSTRFPWVEEKQARSWFQVIFHRLPLPGNILTASVAGSFEQRSLLFENIDAVKALIGRGVLKLRSSTLPDPLATPFPLEPASP